ncbi:unnamed protein product [Penicillium bialowiezense]
MRILLLPPRLSSEYPACRAGAIPVPPAMNKISSVSFGIAHSIFGPRSSTSAPTSMRETSPNGSFRMKKRKHPSFSSSMVNPVAAVVGNGV